MLNILNGGAHADTSVDIQEFMVAPVGAATFREALRWGAEVYHALKSVLKARGLATAIGDEGGFAPDLPANREALDLIVEAIEQAGFVPGQDVALALDIAATEFCEDGAYVFEGGAKSSAEMAAYYAGLVADYPIVSIEDPMSEEDWAGWRGLTEELGTRVQLVGDDIFVTNQARLARGIADHCANALLVKINQIGTLTGKVCPPSYDVQSVSPARRNTMPSPCATRIGSPPPRGPATGAAPSSVTFPSPVAV